MHPVKTLNWKISQINLQWRGVLLLALCRNMPSNSEVKIQCLLPAPSHSWVQVSPHWVRPAPISRRGMMCGEQKRSNFFLLLLLLHGAVLGLLLATATGDIQSLLKAGNWAKFRKLKPKCSCVFPFLLWHMVLSAKECSILFKVIIII